MTENYLQDIGAWTAAEVAARRRTRSLLEALAVRVASVIAEFKRCSPSQGAIRSDANVAETRARYGAAGAAAISVLTSERDFGGRSPTSTPCALPVGSPAMAKDFTVLPEQVARSALAGRRRDPGDPGDGH